MTRKTVVVLCTATGLVAAAAVTAARAPARHHALASNPAGACNARSAPPPSASSGLPFGTVNAGFVRGKVLTAGGESYVSVEIATRDAVPAGPRPPLRLGLVIDHSGSMASEDKLVNARLAASGLISRLKAGDSAFVVEYDSRADVLVPLTPVENGGRERLLAAIARIQPRAGTNLNGGLELGLKQLDGATGGSSLNRVILLSDGLANEGVTDPAFIAGNARAAAERGVRVTTVGLGAEYNEDLMEAIAENGRGQYYYAREASALDRVFAQEAGALQATVATGVELRLEPACAGVELIEVPGYQTRREGSALVAPLADLSGGENRRLLVKVRLPAQAAGAADALRIQLAWQDAKSSGTARREALALGVQVTADTKASEASVNREVMASVLQVESAEAMRRAAAEYEQGRVAEANRILAEKQARLVSLGNQYSLPQAQIQAPVQQMQKQAVDYDMFDPGSFSGKSAIKSSKSSARAWSKSGKF